MVTTPARRQHVAAALGLLAAAATLATALLFQLAVRTAEGQRLDDLARGNLSRSDAPRAFDATQRLLETISISSLALFGLGIMAVALARRSPARALGAGVVVLGANLTTQAIKAHFDRPDLVGSGLTTGGAFPSGHVTVAMSLAMGLVLVAPTSFRWTATLIGCAYAAGVGVAVIALDWHRPSEVVGAYLVCVAWTAAVGSIVVGTDRPEDLDGRDHRVAHLGGLIAAVLLVAFATVVGVTASRRLDVMRIVDDRTAFAAGAVVCVAACAALGALVATLLQRADSDNGARRARDR